MVAVVDVKSLARQVVFVSLAIECWSGRRNLQPADLGLDAASLPPEELISLGQKTLINPAELKVFTTLRAAARRECLAVGARFLGGFVVPDGKAPALLSTLDELERRFTAARQRFIAVFDDLVQDWVQAHPGWERLIRHALVTSQYVAQRLSFSVQAMRFAPAEGITHGGLETAAAGLAGTLFHEIAHTAHEALARSYLGRTSVTRRALRPLMAMRGKLEGLAFLDRRVTPIVRDIDQLLGSLPRQGAIMGRDLQALVGFLAILEDPERMRAHGEALLGGADAEVLDNGEASLAEDVAGMDEGKGEDALTPAMEAESAEEGRADVRSRDRAAPAAPGTEVVVAPAKESLPLPMAAKRTRFVRVVTAPVQEMPKPAPLPAKRSGFVR